MAIKLRITNIKKLETVLRGGVRAFSSDLQREMYKEVNQWAKSLIRAIQTDNRFAELMSSEDLRGKLGMPKSAFKQGGDTDAEDLIELLRTYTVKSSINLRFKSVKVKFPTMRMLRDRLTRSLSKVQDGTVSAGPQQSWFRWWEFGDQGEITSLTVLRSTISRLNTQRGRTRSRGKLLSILQKKSRSGLALQIPSIRSSIGSGIAARYLVSEKYVSFARIFPARIGKKLKNYVRTHPSRIKKLLTRSRVR